VPPAEPHGSYWNVQRTVGVVLGGAGVATGVVSLVFTAKALTKKSDAGAFCNGSACTSQQGVDLLGDARAAGNVATITGIVGIALAGAGVVLFLTAPSRRESVAIAPTYLAGGGAVVATGKF
jgi:hypothetical protein